MENKEYKETILSVDKCINLLLRGIDERIDRISGIPMSEFISGFCYLVKYLSDDPDLTEFILHTGVNYYNSIKEGGQTHERS